MNKKIVITLLLILIFEVLVPRIIKLSSPNHTQNITPSRNKSPDISPTPAPKPLFLPPLDRSQERVSKKFFGTFVSPSNSPVQPERFTGFHTGVDFETFPDEVNSVVDVHSICDGKIISRTTLSGYGGVTVQSCTLDGQPITVIYGHLKLSSINFSIGDDIKAGNTLAELGKGFSSETDGERKHLHLGIHKGTAINYLGYVPLKSQLSDWIDPCLYVCGR